jgi:hypothetical protein
MEVGRVNVFVLCTGRCGSMTWAKACSHITNYTSAHESRCRALGGKRLAYPDNHIEVDMRLSWFLGRLERKYGKKALYVHLTRDTKEVAESFVNRFQQGIMMAYRGILCDTHPTACGVCPLYPTMADPLAVATDYVHNVNANIRAFLRGKPNRMGARLETIADDFRRFWEWIGAEGDLDAALEETQTHWNAS